MDIWLLILMLVFSIFGLIMIFSASSVSTVLRYNVPQYHFFLRQAIFLISSFIAGFLIVIRFPTSKYKYLTPLAILAIIVALIGLLVYGKLTNNVRSWYDLGFFALQPSEFAKSIVIVFLAVSYSRLEKIKNVKKLFDNFRARNQRPGNTLLGDPFHNSNLSFCLSLQIVKAEAAVLLFRQAAPDLFQ